MVGSQLMMVVSPVLGPRNLIFGLIMFAFACGIIISKLNFKKLNNTILVIIFILMGLTSNLDTARGYYQNKLIEEKNISIIFANTDVITKENFEISLYKFKNDNYAWSMPYISKYHEYWFKIFYDMKCKINWK